MIWEKQDDIKYKWHNTNDYIKEKIDPEYRFVLAA